MSLRNGAVLREEFPPPVERLDGPRVGPVPVGARARPAQRGGGGEREAGFRRALASLEESQREVLLLHYVEDLSLAEAAKCCTSRPMRRGCVTFAR
jgi:DNA-directed RNA polymerase specialized sigma24 family protein